MEFNCSARISDNLANTKNLSGSPTSYILVSTESAYIRCAIYICICHGTRLDLYMLGSSIGLDSTIIILYIMHAEIGDMWEPMQGFI